MSQSKQRKLHWLKRFIIVMSAGLILTAASAFVVRQHTLTQKEYCAANWYGECPSRFPSAVVNEYGWPLALSARVVCNDRCDDSMGDFLKTYGDPQLTTIDEANLQDIFITHGLNLIMDLTVWIVLAGIVFIPRDFANRGAPHTPKSKAVE